MSEHTYKMIKGFSGISVVLVLISLVGITTNSYFRIKPNELVAESKFTPQSTIVLGTQETDGLNVREVKFDPDGFYYITVQNSSSRTLEFSPGLQLFGITDGGIQVPIAILDSLTPLSGGPITPGEVMGGKLGFGDVTIYSIRLYSEIDKTSYSDVVLQK